MKYTATLNGVKVTKEIPTNWEMVTFEQYMKLVEINNDPVEVLAFFLGVDSKTLAKVKLVGVEDIIRVLSFTKVPPPLIIPKTILGYKIPKDLSFETTGQYKDCQMIAGSMRPNGDELSIEDQIKYLDIVAVFAMPNYFDSSEEEKAEFAKKFLNAPCGEVLAVGNFTLLKSIGLKLNIRPASPNRSGRMRKLRLGIKIWLKNTALALRFAWLKRKLGQADMSL